MKPKVAEALEKQVTFGGAIKKPKYKKRELKPKIKDALDAQASKRRYHDSTHKFMMENLSGRGGAFDAPLVRQAMHQLTSTMHPKIYESYHRGKGMSTFEDRSDMPGKPIGRHRPDTKAHFIAMGGSLNALTHSVNGQLQAFDSTFYSHLQL